MVLILLGKQATMMLVKILTISCMQKNVKILGESELYSIAELMLPRTISEKARDKPVLARFPSIVALMG